MTSGYNTGFSTVAGTAITTPYIDPKTGKPSSTADYEFQFVFVFDVSTGALVKRQQIELPNAFDGLAWDPAGMRFYVSGGQDDRVYIFKRSRAGWVIDAPLPVLGHNTGDDTATPTYDGGMLKFTPAYSSALVQQLGLGFGPMTAGVNVTDDGKTLVAANLQNDSISIVNLKTRAAREFKLFDPGSRAAFGEFPYWVQPHSRNPGGPADKIYVTSLRDGQIISISTRGFENTINVGGEPAKMILTRDERFLLVANPDLDEIEVVDTASDTLRERISVARPGYRYRGSSPNSLALGADGRTLYVTLAGENAVGVIDLASGSLVGRIPTGWYPSSVTVSADGLRLFVAIPKSNAGPADYGIDESDNPLTLPDGLDDYVYNLEKSGLQTIPVPDAETLAYLSAVVDANDGFGLHGRSAMMRFLHAHIRRRERVKSTSPVIASRGPRLISRPAQHRYRDCALANLPDTALGRGHQPASSDR